MTFSFDASLATDTDLVRFHIGDTNSDGHFLEDETIQYLLTEKGSVGYAVIDCIRYIITQLNQPNFKLDWLSVDNSKAVEMYQTILKQKIQEFGLSVYSANIVSSISLPTRLDSDQEGDY